MRSCLRQPTYSARAALTASFLVLWRPARRASSTSFASRLRLLAMCSLLTRSLTAANPVLLPKPEPRTMREQVVVPAIRRRNVAGVQRPGIRDRVHALQPLDLGNGPLGVHPSQYGPENQEGQSAAVSPKTLTDGLSAASRSSSLTRGRCHPERSEGSLHFAGTASNVAAPPTLWLGDVQSR